MCMGCMSNADFLVSSGVLGVGSLRVGLRAIVPVTPKFARKVTDDEATAFVASLAPSAPSPITIDDAVPAGR